MSDPRMQVIFAKLIIGEENYNWLDKQSKADVLEFAISADGKATIQLAVDEFKKFMASKSKA